MIYFSKDQTSKYEIVLGPAARRAVLGLETQQNKDDLADALRTELDGGPNLHHEYPFQIGNGEVYTATPLSFKGWTAVHRRLTTEELRRLEDEQGRQVEASGFLLFDFLRPQSAFHLGPRAPVNP